MRYGTIAHGAVQLLGEIEALIRDAEKEASRNQFETFKDIYQQEMLKRVGSITNYEYSVKDVNNLLDKLKADYDKGEVKLDMKSLRNEYKLSDEEVDIVFSHLQTVGKFDKNYKKILSLFECYIGKVYAGEEYTDPSIIERLDSLDDTMDLQDFELRQIGKALEINSVKALPERFLTMPKNRLTDEILSSMADFLIKDDNVCASCDTLRAGVKCKISYKNIVDAYVDCIEKTGKHHKNVKKLVKAYKETEFYKRSRTEQGMEEMSNMEQTIGVEEMSTMGAEVNMEQTMRDVIMNIGEVDFNRRQTTVDLTKYREMSTADEIRKLKGMTPTEIESYGSDIQAAMSESSKVLLDRVNMVELGDTREQIDELSDIVKQHKKLLPILQSPLGKLRKFSGKFVKVQGRLDEIESSLMEQSEKVSTYVTYMEQQQENLGVITKSLRTAENSLSDYAQQIQFNDDESLRYQSVTNRLRIITDTRVIAEQTQAEALMIIGEQREVKAQLEAVIKNALPAIHIQAVNSVGIRVTKETQEIINKTRELTSNILVQNAKDVRDMAVELQNNKTRSIADGDKLMKAQAILSDTMKVIMETSEQEARVNHQLAESLREHAKQNMQFIEQLESKTFNANRKDA